MTTFAIITLIVLPIVGGLAAWLGDVIGYRLGRSRRTLFGLRPRTTARLIGVLVGAVLPLLGLAFAAIGSEQVRVALLQLDELRERSRRLAYQNKMLEASRSGLQQQVKDLRRQEATARARADAAESRAAQAREQAEQARVSLRRVNEKLTASQRHLERARRELQALTAQIGALTAQVKELEGERKQLTQRLAEERERATELEKEREAVQKRLDEAQQGLARLREEQDRLTEQRDALRSERDRLQRAVQDLDRQREQLTRELQRAERAVKATQEALAENSRKLEEAQQRLEMAREYMQSLREQYRLWLEKERAIEESPVVYEPGDELVRATVSARQRHDQLEAALSEVLVLANNAALRRGVPPDKTGRAVILARPLPVTSTLDRRPEEEDIIHYVAERILEGTADSYVVVVRSLERHFMLEPRQVRVELWFTPDKERFHKGEVIQRMRFEPPMDRAAILQRILGLRRHLRQIAAARGLLPDPESGEYGAVLAEDVIRAVDEIAKAKQPMELWAVVGKPVRTAQPLVVRLEVKKARG